MVSKGRSAEGGVPGDARLRCDNWREQNLDTVEHLSPSFHAAPEGLVTMIYCHAKVWLI